MRPFLFSLLQSRSQRRLLYACFFAFFCIGLLTLTLGSVLPDMKAAYGLSSSFSGVLLAVYSTGNLAAGIFGGMAALRFGERRSVVILTASACLGMFLLAASGTPALLFAGCLLIGLGRGSIVNFGTRAVNLLTDGSPAASNLLHASFAVGAIAAPVLFMLLRSLFNWKAGLVLVLLFMAGAALNFLRVDSPAGPEESESEELEELKENKNASGCPGGSLAFLKDPSFLVLAAMMFCYLCSEYAINGWLVTCIQHRDTLTAALSSRGPDAVAAYSQMMATLLWAVILAGRLACAVLSRRVPQRFLLLFSGAGAAFFFGGMLLGDSPGTVGLCVAGLGFCMAGISPMIFSSAACFTNKFPLATGTLFTIGGVGGVLMPFIVGVLAELHGFGGGMAAVLASFCLLIVFAALNLFNKKIK